MNLGRTYSNLDQEAIETTQVVKSGDISEEHKEEVIGENREAEGETKSRNEKKQRVLISRGYFTTRTQEE